MKAVIPVAGFGTRLRPHTLTNPKVLIPIAGKPMIAHVVDSLIADGIEEVIFVVGFLGDKIEEYLKKHYKISMHFVEQKETLGLGHAIFTARDTIKNNEPFVIILGDTLFDADLKKAMSQPYSSLGVKEVDDPRRFGVAVLDEDGFVSRMVEKPQEPVSNLALVGLYVIKSSQLLFDSLEEIIKKDVRTKNEYQLTDGLQLMIDQGEKMTVFNIEGWYDCGKIETVLDTNEVMVKKLYSDKKYTYPNTVIIPPVYIHPDAKIQNSVIGPNVSIDTGSVLEKAIISHTIIGSNTHIQQAQISHSLIGNHVKLAGKLQRLSLGDYSETHL